MHSGWPSSRTLERDKVTNKDVVSDHFLAAPRQSSGFSHVSGLPLIWSTRISGSLPAPFLSNFQFCQVKVRKSTINVHFLIFFPSFYRNSVLKTLVRKLLSPRVKILQSGSYFRTGLGNIYWTCLRNLRRFWVI